MRAIVFVFLLIFLLGQAGPAPQVAAQTAPATDSARDAVLMGRNCGSTTLLAAAARAGAGQRSIRPGAAGSHDWGSEGDFLDGTFDQTELASGGITLSRFGWSANSTLDDNGTRQGSASLAVRPDGTVAVAWQEAPGRDAGDIFVAATPSQSSSPAQLRRGFRVDDTGNAAVDQSDPSLAASADDVLYAAWTDQRRGQSDIYFSRSRSGQTWSANLLLSNSAAGLNHANPHLITGASRQVYVVWESSGTQNIVLFTQTSDSGLSWSDPIAINDQTAATYRRAPRLARAPDGSLYAAWEDSRNGNSDIFAARFGANGLQTWGQNVRVNDDTGNAAQTDPGLAVGPDGTLYVVWRDWRNGDSAIYLARSSDGGQTWSANTRIDQGGAANFPRIAVDGRGTVYCVWCQLGEFADIYAARSNDGGQTWRDRGAVNDKPGATSSSPPTLGADSQGTMHVAWSDNRADPLTEEIYYARWPNPRRAAPVGSYLSTPLDAGRSVQWTSLDWTAEQPTGSSIALAIRVGSRPSPDSSWSAWLPLDATPANLHSLPSARYVQWRADLRSSTGSASPSLARVSVAWDDTQRIFVPLVAR